jgi:hypothetical protein
MVRKVKSPSLLEPMPVDERAITILRAKGPVTCAQLGEYLWAHLSPSGRGRPGTAPYARAAGRVLRLERAGRVCRSYDGHSTLWSLAFKEKVSANGLVCTGPTRGRAR